MNFKLGAANLWRTIKSRLDVITEKLKFDGLAMLNKIRTNVLVLGNSFRSRISNIFAALRYNFRLFTYNIFKRSGILRFFVFELTFLISFNLLFMNTRTFRFDKKEILGILISVISIIVAIIVTYLFSKLFTEKSIKIERKKEIDKLSSKITSLRKIAFHIRNMHNFWRFGENNIKGAIDHGFPNLTYEEYRGSYIEGRDLTYDEWVVIDEAIFSTSGQSYLAIKGLVDGENDFSMFGEFTPRNYSLEDVVRYKEYTGSFWYLLDRSDNTIVNFNNVHRYWLKSIDELYFKIKGIAIDEADRKTSIKNLLADFESLF